MKSNTTKVLSFLVLLLLSSCSAVSWKGQTNFGVKQIFVSQAGLCNNKVLITTGKVDSSSSSDGWGMIDARTDKLVRISGDAIIIDATEEQIKVYTSASSLKEAQEKLNKLIQDDGTIIRQPLECNVIK